MSVFVKRTANVARHAQPSTKSLAYKAKVAAFQKKKAAASKKPTVKTGLSGKSQFIK